MRGKPWRPALWAKATPIAGPRGSGWGCAQRLKVRVKARPGLWHHEELFELISVHPANFSSRKNGG